MEYPYESIIKLSEKISNMRDKKYKKDLKSIKKIIEDNNPDISMTKNNNGYFSPDFETLSYETYVELEKYLSEIKDREKSAENTITDSEHHVFSASKNNDNLNKRLKYTNSENLILNKIKYENALKEHQSEYSEKKEEHIEIRDLAKILKQDSETKQNLMLKKKKKITNEMAKN
jgi:hypothetical protein